MRTISTRSDRTRPRMLVRALTVVLLTLIVVASARARPEPARVGVLYHRDDTDVEAALRGLREGFELAGREAVWIQADAHGDAASGRMALEGLRIEGVEVVVAIGERAAQVAARGKRDRPVLCTGLSDARVVLGDDLEAFAGTTSSLPPQEILGLVRRSRPAWTRLSLVVGAEDSHTRRRAEAVRREASRTSGSLGEERSVDLLADGDGSVTERAERLAEALAGSQVVWFERDVDARVVDRVSRILSDTDVVLIGTRRSHLDAGCPVIVRPDTEAQGQRAAGVLARLLAGEGAEHIGFVDAGSHRLELSLPAARRLGVELPLPLLASAHRIRPVLRRTR